MAISADSRDVYLAGKPSCVELAEQLIWCASPRANRRQQHAAAACGAPGAPPQPAVRLGTPPAASTQAARRWCHSPPSPPMLSPLAPLAQATHRWSSRPRPRRRLWRGGRSGCAGFRVDADEGGATFGAPFASLAPTALPRAVTKPTPSCGLCCSMCVFVVRFAHTWRPHVRRRFACEGSQPRSWSRPEGARQRLPDAAAAAPRGPPGSKAGPARRWRRVRRRRRRRRRHRSRLPPSQ